MTPESDLRLLNFSPSITHHDCDIVVLERQYYEECNCLPSDLFVPSRHYKTVYLDCSDGIKTFTWLPEFQQFDFIFKTHYTKNTKYPNNVYPWAFGLSERVLQELREIPPWTSKKSSLLVNFRHNKFSHSLRRFVQKSFISQIQNCFSLDTTLDNLTLPPQDSYHYLMWSQTGRRHYPQYYQRLKYTQACACFGGYFLAPWFTDSHEKISYYLARIISELGLKTKRIGQWDSWRFWESLAAGCVTFHVDFNKYGFKIPVMPENWKHYIGIDLDNISASIEKIANNPEILEQIAEEGRKWAITNYAPQSTARRFLETVAQNRSFKINN